VSVKIRDAVDVNPGQQFAAHSQSVSFWSSSSSSLLNTAEGNGRRQRQTRAKFFDDARGSVTECAACLDALVAKGICTKEEIQQGKEMLLRIASMLTKLISLFDSSPNSVVREEPPDEESLHEDEDDDEDESRTMDP
jgi:four helix bundle protein